MILPPLLFYPIYLLPSLPILPNIHSILVGTYIYLFIFYQDIYLPIFFLSLLLIYSFSHSSSHPLPHSFYTCRYLHILIYIPFLSPSQQFFLSQSQSDPARSIGVDVSSGVVLLVCVYVLRWCSERVGDLTLGVILYTILYIYYYYTILFSSDLYSSSIPSFLPIYLLFYSSFILFLPILFYPSPSILLPFPISIILICSPPNPLLYSFYTCRYLHILIYIPDSSPTI